MLSVRDQRELQAAVLALKSADRALRSAINRATVRVGNAIWKPAVQAHARTEMDSRVLVTGARVKGGNPPVAVAASSTRRIGRTKRFVPAERWPGYEFGADRNVESTYERKGSRVTRHTRRGLPQRQRKGRVVYPAFAEVAPRMVSLWVQIIVKFYRDAAEGKADA